MKHLCVLVMLSSAGCAQSALSLKEAVREALASHPLLAASSERVAASEGLRTQAGLRPPAFPCSSTSLHLAEQSVVLRVRTDPEPHQVRFRLHSKRSVVQTHPN
jgi:hypothetical protein